MSTYKGYLRQKLIRQLIATLVSVLSKDLSEMSFISMAVGWAFHISNRSTDCFKGDPLLLQ